MNRARCAVEEKQTNILVLRKLCIIYNKLKKETLIIVHDFTRCLCYECSCIILNSLNNVLYTTTNCCRWSHLKFYVHPNSVHGWFLIPEGVKRWKLPTTYRQRFVLIKNVRGADYHTLIGWQANDPIVTEGFVNHILQQFIWTARLNEGCDHHEGNITSI